MKLKPFALERWMTTWEMLVEYDICESGILPMSLRDLYDLIGTEAAATLAEEIATMPQMYSEARGTETLRLILASTYANTQADNILVTTGAIEANFLLFNTLVSEGDHVVAVTPAYQQLNTLPEALGARVDFWDVRQADGTFAYDLNQLESLLKPDTRLIVINTPHNPTGAIIDSDQMDSILAMAREREAWVLSDEAYRWLNHAGGAKPVEPARNRYERAISVGTTSKPFGMPGLRIGWFAAPSEIAAQAWGIRDYVSLSPSRISDRVTQTLIEHRSRVQVRNQAIMTENLGFARDWFVEHADLATWQEPKAALLAMMKLQTAIPSETVANRLAKEKSVMLAPGSAFGMEGHLRIGIGQRPDVFAEGLRRTGDFLRSL